ncbi:MAG: lytic transglycosylase domain-containing protein [Firmicutes bacterium]|nr:lytic transglycosylase domain-containing protein [Bacillota bacterium]
MWKIFVVILILVIALTGATVGIFFAAYPLRFRDEIREASIRFDVEPGLVASVIRAESGFRPNSVSPKGAVGLMQVMPATARYVVDMIKAMPGLDLSEDEKIALGNLDNLHDPRVNITIGVAYISYLIGKFGDVRTAVIAYNAGEGNVRRWLGREDLTKTITKVADGEVRQIKVLHTSPFPETNAYVARVMNAIRVYRSRV